MTGMGIGNILANRPMPRPDTANGGGGFALPGGMDASVWSQLLGSVNMPEEQRTQLPQTTFPDIPRTIDPKFAVLLLQTLMGNQYQPQGLGNWFGGGR